MKKSTKKRLGLFAFVLFVTLYTSFVLVTLPTEPVIYERQPEPLILATTTVAEFDEILEVKPQVPALYPTLKRICSCESTGRPDNEPRQFDSDGNVLRGIINPLDTGMCQINLKYHEATAIRMGLDLETAYGNASYANWLFDTQGATPWEWSRSCWGG